MTPTRKHNGESVPTQDLPDRRPPRRPPARPHRRRLRCRKAGITARTCGPERVGIDYAGDPIERYEINTGEIHKAYVFVSGLGLSQLPFACAAEDKKSCRWGGFSRTACFASRFFRPAGRRHSLGGGCVLYTAVVSSSLCFVTALGFAAVSYRPANCSRRPVLRCALAVPWSRISRV